ncbi:MAG: TlpA disulfide reductase family protein [Bacteroidales bacterium]|nr:TlpA disulfide reductase family protein [Bacteroidales bacterium]
MRKLFVAALLSFAVMSCTKQTSKAIIEGTITDMQSGNLVLKMLDVNTQIEVDTIVVKSGGKFSYKVKKSSDTPEFYYLYHKSTRIASMILMPGDKINITSDTLGINSSVEGSPESSLLNNLEKELGRSQHKFDSLYTLMTDAKSVSDAKRVEEFNLQLGSLYVKQKQAAIKYIYTNPRSITGIMLLYHRFAPDVPLFADVRDVLIFRKVYDTLQTIYPKSVYLSRLLDEIGHREQTEAFNNKILDASERGFPDITLPDREAKMRSLSDLSGKVVILSFWSITDANQRMMNQDLLDLYSRFNSRGLEIYQVSVDTDKTAWARAVAEQNLPWISVCDGFGSGSVAVSTYNIQKVPTIYVIDKSGTIAAKDIFDAELERKIATLLK